MKGNGVKENEKVIFTLFPHIRGQNRQTSYRREYMNFSCLRSRIRANSLFFVVFLANFFARFHAIKGKFARIRANSREKIRNEQRCM